jgi:hypothetical protein
MQSRILLAHVFELARKVDIPAEQPSVRPLDGQGLCYDSLTEDDGFTVRVPSWCIFPPRVVRKTYGTFASVRLQSQYRNTIRSIIFIHGQVNHLLLLLDHDAFVG